MMPRTFRPSATACLLFVLHTVSPLAQNARAAGPQPPPELFGLTEEDSYSVAPAKVVKECSAIIVRKPKPDRDLLERAYNSRTFAYIALRRFPEAKADIEESLRFRPNDPELKRRHAAVLFALGHRQEALQELQAVTRAFPRHPGARAALAGQLAGVGRNKEAMEQINTAISMDKENPFFRYTRAIFNYQQSRFEEALEDVSFLISKVPFYGFSDPAEPYLLRGNCLLALGRSRAAIPNFLLAKGLSPSNTTVVLGLWKAYSGMGKWEVAYSLAEECVRSDPKSLTAKILYVAASYKADKLAEGEKMVRSLLADYPKDSNVLSAAGSFYCGAAKPGIGLGYFDKALELDGNDISSLYGKALCLASDPNKDVRNGPLAVKLAERLLHLESAPKAIKLQGTMLLAIAKAECGEFETAVSLAKAAIKEVGSEAEFQQRDFKEKLRLFEEKKPYREKRDR